MNHSVVSLERLTYDEEGNRTMRDFEYEAPQTVAEAVAVLGRFNGQARPLAGGTDLIDQIRVSRHAPSVVVDIKKLPD